MDIKKINDIRTFYNFGATHQQIIDEFGINLAQSLAINIVSKLQVSDEFLLAKMDEITPEMNPDKIRQVLGLS